MVSGRQQTLVDSRSMDRVPVDDRGLAYGDGVFETLRVFRGQPLFLQAHLERLALGCRRLAIAADLPALEADIRALAASDSESDAVLKVVVTAGSSSRGYARDASAQPRIILQRRCLESAGMKSPPRALKLRYCQTQLATNPGLAGIKHLNRLEQVLARAELAADVDEGLVCDLEGWVVEATAANLFAVIEGQLLTPPVDRCGIQGVVRRILLEEGARRGCPVEERRLSPEDLAAADALMLTNSLIQVAPVGRLENRSYQSQGWAGELRAWLAAAGGLPC